MRPDLFASLVVTFVITVLSSIGFAVSEEGAPPPSSLPASVVSYGVEPTTTTSTTTTVPPTSTLPIVQTTTTVEPHYEGGQEPRYDLPTGKCSEWYGVAVNVGWPEDRLQTMGKIMWAESRCQPEVSNCCSYGLLQMEWSAHKHWLAEEFFVTDREQLYDPRTNLTVGLWLAEYAEEHYGCWAQPWYMSGEWC